MEGELRIVSPFGNIVFSARDGIVTIAQDQGDDGRRNVWQFAAKEAYLLSGWLRDAASEAGRQEDLKNRGR